MTHKEKAILFNGAMSVIRKDIEPDEFKHNIIHVVKRGGGFDIRYGEKSILTICISSTDMSTYVYGSMIPEVRTIQNIFLNYLGYKITKVRNKDISVIRNISTDAAIGTVCNTFYPDTISIHIDFRLVNQAGALYQISSLILRKESCRVSQRIIDSRYASRRLNEDLLFDLDPSYEFITYNQGSKGIGLNSRVNIKIGKGIKKMFPNVNFSDHDIEQFVNRVKAKSPTAYDFKIVEGEEIRDFYNGNCYEANTSTLEGSCMKYEECQPYLDIYVKNPDNCKMLILESAGMIIGRALLWYFKQDGEDFTIMDRIYGNDATISRFIDWAKENNVWTKERQSYDYKTTWVKPDGEKITKEFFIPLKNMDFKHYPYIDTFTYVHEDGLGNHQSNKSQSKGYANSTGGHYEDVDDRVWCEIDEQWIDEDDAIYVEGTGYVYYSYSVWCESNRCNILEEDAVMTHDGNYCHTDDAIHCDYNDEYCIDGDEETCDYSNETYIPSITSTVEIDGIGTVIADYKQDALDSLDE